MTKYVHLVFSDPPAGVTEADFNEWYDAHVQEILAVEGWVAATRYRIAPEVGADESGGYRFLSLYELDVPPEQAVANLAAAGMGNADTYIEMKGEHDRRRLRRFRRTVRHGRHVGEVLPSRRQR